MYLPNSRMQNSFSSCIALCPSLQKKGEMWLQFKSCVGSIAERLCDSVVPGKINFWTSLQQHTRAEGVPCRALDQSSYESMRYEWREGRSARDSKHPCQSWLPLCTVWWANSNFPKVTHKLHPVPRLLVCYIFKDIFKMNQTISTTTTFIQYQKDQSPLFSFFFLSLSFLLSLKFLCCRAVYRLRPSFFPWEAAAASSSEGERHQITNWLQNKTK